MSCFPRFHRYVEKLTHIVNQVGEDGTKTKLTTTEAVSDGLLAVIAGSDTTAIALSQLWYFLLRHSDCYLRLRKEIAATFPDMQAPYDFSKTSEMPYLNACL